MYDSVLTNVRFLEDKNRYSIGMIDGKISVITKENINGIQNYDAEGDFILPAFVEMHTHLDTALTAGDPAFSQSGTLFEGIQIWQERKKLVTEEDVISRATIALRMLIEHGVLHVRAAVDISQPTLDSLKALLKVRESFKDLIDLQIIAFPQDGLISCPENRERLEKALLMGADAASAVPHLETTRENGIASLDYCFSLAKVHQKFVHVFCDEVDDGHSRFIEAVADLTIKYSMEGLVTASHANAMAYYSDAYSQKIFSLINKAKLTIVSCPLISSVTQGRFDSSPKGRGITRVKELHESGVSVCIAHDDIRSPFYPFGNGNILQAAHMASHLAHMTGEKEVLDIIQMITENGAKAFGIASDYGIEEGNSASFITVPADDIMDLFSRQLKSRYVFKNGRLIVSTPPSKSVWFVEQKRNVGD
ncbi:amidohydrolase family protein [Bacillus gobiensis]|uniref:amidohydrolase family protein n=1 Tax=Bacillus gobiensis TaxID=1441095 RepID=UPI003D1BD054